MTRNLSDSNEEQSVRRRYPGPSPFSDSAEDHARFFGRGEEEEQLYLRVLSVPLLVHYGKSGLGKTSLLQAGLVPRLREKPFLPVMIRLNIVEQSLALAVADSIKQACKTEKLELTEGKTDGLWELLTTSTVWRDDLLLTPVLVFDQFEEVFTLRDPTFRAGLAMELGALASGCPPDRVHASGPGVPVRFGGRPKVKIVISLREEYLGALEEFSAAIPRLFHERLRLEPLTGKMARKAIIRPALLTAAAGEEPYWAPRFVIKRPALDSMFKHLKGKSGTIEPFHLQLLCRYAEDLAHNKTTTGDGLIKLTLDDIKGGKDFESVIRDYYLDTLQKLPLPQRWRARALFEEGLLNDSGRRVPLDEEQIRKKYGLEAKTLTTLSENRLVRQVPWGESVVYEISHDQLAASIFSSRRYRLPKSAIIGFSVCLLVVIIVFLGLGWRKDRTNRLINHGNTALQDHKYKEAAQCLKEVIYGSDNYLKYMVYWRGEDISSVRDSLGRAYFNMETVIDHHNKKIGCENEDKDHSKLPPHGSNYYNAMNEFNRAIELSSKKREEYQVLATSNLYIGDIHISLGNCDKAIKAYQEVVGISEADPNLKANGYLKLGYTYYRKGKREQALQAFHNARQCRIQDLRLVADAFSVVGEYQEAIAQYNLVIPKVMGTTLHVDKQELAKAYMGLGNVLLSQGKSKERECSQDARNDYQEAVDNFNYAIKIEPDNAGAYLSLANSYLALEEYVMAKDEFVKAQQHCSQDKQCEASAWFGIGQAYAGQGHQDNAIEPFKKVCELDPQSTNTLYARSELAYIFLEKERKQATKFFEEVQNSGESLNARLRMDEAFCRKMLAIADKLGRREDWIKRQPEPCVSPCPSTEGS